MGLIREPKNINFYVLDKIWTNAEREEFSEFIKLRKEELKKSPQLKKALKLDTGKQPTEQGPSFSKTRTKPVTRVLTK